MSLVKLFSPHSIAIIGASEEEGKVGNAIAKNILNLGYSGQVFLVNPKHEEMFGQKCYRDVLEIEEEVDLAIVVIPAKAVNEVVEKSVVKIKNFVVISAGFSETGEEGKKREEELNDIVRRHELNILGPNCLGFIVPEIKLNASFASGMPEGGNIAFVSQSGALAVALMDKAKKEGLGFSSIVSIGNKMQLSETELLEFFEQDENTKVIGMYLEGIKDGQKFLRMAREIHKPIVVLKSGKNEKSQKAISSHTGALAGSDEIMDAAFKKAGIVRARNLEEFFSLLDLMSKVEPPQNNEVAVVTNAGGPGVLTTDEFSNKEIKLSEVSEKAKKELQEFLPAESSLANPIDMLGDADETRYEKTLAVLEKEKADTIMVILTPQDQTPVDKIVDKLVDYKNRTQKKIIASFVGGNKVEEAGGKLEQNGIPNFDWMEQGIGALEKYYAWKTFHDHKQKYPAIKLNERRKHKVREMILQTKKEGRKALSYPEACEAMKEYSIETNEAWEVSDLERVNIDFPVVLKVDSDKVLHKTDKQGIVLGIKNQEELAEAIRKMHEIFPGENLIVQSMLPIKTELIVGIKQDSIFGPVVVYGLGGIYTEVFKMVDFLLPPISKEEILEEILASKIGFLFRETRGQKAYDGEELAEILMGVMNLALEVPEIKEFDINPLLVYNDGSAAKAVDVKIVI